MKKKLLIYLLKTMKNDIFSSLCQIIFYKTNFNIGYCILVTMAMKVPLDLHKEDVPTIFYRLCNSLKQIEI